MKICNGFSIMVREKPRERALGGMILLPGTKYTSSKIGICLATEKKKFKQYTRESHIQTGDRVFAHQADQGHMITAWDNLTFVMPPDHSIKPERLPDGVELVETRDGLHLSNFIQVTKGTPLQVWLGVGDDMCATVGIDMEIDD